MIGSQTDTVRTASKPGPAEAPPCSVLRLGNALLLQRDKQFHARLNGHCQKLNLTGEKKRRKQLTGFNKMKEQALHSPIAPHLFRKLTTALRGSMLPGCGQIQPKGPNLCPEAGQQTALCLEAGIVHYCKAMSNASKCHQLAHIISS